MNLKRFVSLLSLVSLAWLMAACRTGSTGSPPPRDDPDDRAQSRRAYGYCCVSDRRAFD